MKIVKKILIITGIAILMISLVCIAYILEQILYVQRNPINWQENSKITYATCIYDNNGELIYKLGDNRAKSSYTADIPDIVKKALISIEDKRFYEHKGIDMKRTGSAIINYVFKGDSSYGGSTITQQLVKNVTGESEKNITRKVREWFYAIDVEKKHNKDFIITQYLNIVYFGNGVYGIKDAAKYYFDKELKDLSINEIAYLVGIIQTPEKYVRNEELANNRKNVVLKCMCSQGYIYEEEYSQNVKNKISIPKKAYKADIQSYFVDSIIDNLSEVLSEKYNISKNEAMYRIYTGGYKIYSTLDVAVQNTVDEVYDNLDGIQSAIVIMSNDGKVVAIRGGTGKKAADMVLNRATSSRRQPGSAFKPIAVYAPAIETKVISKDSTVCDKSITYGDWSPRNSYSGFRGNMSVRKALEISCNTVAVQLLEQVGVDKSKSFLSNMNIKLDKEDNNLSMALGGLTYGTTPLEMASGYQTLANKGVYCEPIFFVKVLDKDGNEIYNSEKDQKTKRVFSEETTYIITDLLTSVVNGSEGTARNFKLQNSEVAAKTGTSNDQKDKWLCAYTPYYTVATWYGYDKPQKVSYGASQIQKNTKQVFDKMHSNVEVKTFNIPQEYVTTYVNVKVCNETNLLATDFCKNVSNKSVNSNADMKKCQKCEEAYIIESQKPLQTPTAEVQDSKEDEEETKQDENVNQPNTIEENKNVLTPPQRSEDISSTQ